MRSRSTKALAVLLLAALPFLAAAAALRAEADLRGPAPVPGDRILVLAPHPDDETLGCGGIIQKAVALGVPVRVVFLTYGDDNEWSFLIYRRHPVILPRAVENMGLVRDAEAHGAAARLGLHDGQLTFLGYPDHSVESIWYDHWNGCPPAVGHLSRARQVPYPDAYRPGAPYTGEDIIKDLEAVLREFRPTKVFLSHPADRHPDHRSLYVFTRVALWDLEGEIGRPRLFPYLVHFGGWPQHGGLHEALRLDPPPALRDAVRWTSEALDEREAEVKLEALRQHKSQHESGAYFLDAFVRANELFGDFPELVAGGEGAGFDGSRVRVSNGRLQVEVDLPAAAVEKARLWFRAFGYRRDVPFGRMPKLRVRVAGDALRVFEGGRMLDVTGFEVRKEPSRLVVALPLKVLGDPEKVLIGTRSPLLAGGPVDYFSWRVVVLPGTAPAAGPAEVRGR